MTDEQRAAIERLRRWRSGADWNAVYPGEHQGAWKRWTQDQHDIVGLYLAEHPADDAEPVTSGWLVAVGFHTGGGACWIRGDGPQICIRYYVDATGGHFVTSSLDGPPVLIVGGDGVKWGGTRGEIRRLCASLAVELKSL